MFEQFPYTNFHELNLDWIIEKVKEAYSPDNPPQNVVLSVDGQTGNVRVFPNAIITLPEVTEGTWNLHRIADGQSSGIQFTPNRAERIEGTNRYKMYDEGNPPAYPVTSVNGQTGAVLIQVPVTSVNGETGAIILYQDASMRLPNVSENVWNIYRISNGVERGVQFTPNGAERIEGQNRYYLYDSGNPPPYPVTSVNGQTGAVSIPKVVTDLASAILNIDTASNENYWGLARSVSTGTARIYLDASNNTIKAYISYVSTDGQTTVTLPLLTSADIPSSAGVISINGKTGAVTLYGTDIFTDENSSKTVKQAISENTQAISTETSRAQGQETILAGRITTAEQQNTAQNTAISALENGIAIIVTGDTASATVPVNGYAYIRNNNHGLAEGLYINTSASAFPQTGGTADNTVFTAVSTAGALNELNDKITRNPEYGTTYTNATSEQLAASGSRTITSFTLDNDGGVYLIQAQCDGTASSVERCNVQLTNASRSGVTSTIYEGNPPTLIFFGGCNILFAQGGDQIKLDLYTYNANQLSSFRYKISKLRLR